MKNKERMDVYTKAICNAHGASHPEVFEVRSLYLELVDEVDVNETFKNLRKATNHYKIPDDACETYEAVYKYLEREDRKHHLKEVEG